MLEYSSYIETTGMDHHTGGNVFGGSDFNCDLRNVVVVVVILLLLYMYNEDNDRSDSFQSDYDFSRSSELNAGRKSMMQPNGMTPTLNGRGRVRTLNSSIPPSLYR
jgi:hypothetical protein